MSRLGVMLILLSPTLFGAPVPELEDFTRNEVAILSDALEGSQDLEIDGKHWKLSRFDLGVSAKVGFSVPGVSLTLIPDLDLVWERKK